MMFASSCKNDNFEFIDEISTKKNVNIECTQQHSVSKYFNATNTQEKWVDHDIPAHLTETQNTVLNSLHFIKYAIGKQSEELKDTDSEMEINEFLDNDEEIIVPKYKDIDSSEQEQSSSVYGKKPSECKISENGKDKTEILNFSKYVFDIDTTNEDDYNTVFGKKSSEDIAVIHNFSKDVSDSDTTDDDNSNIMGETKAFGELKKFIKYICPQCGKSCGDFRKWKEHINTKHKLNAIAELNIEITTNTDGKLIHKCRDCSLESTERLSHSKSLRHCISHLAYRKYCICKICSTGFSSKYILVAHIKATHTRMIKNEQTPLSFKDPKYLKYVRVRCPLCFEYQNNTRQKHLHLQLQHDYFNQVKSMISIKNELMTCNVCNSIIRRQTKSGLITHMVTHEPHKSFICELCNNYEATERFSVVRHIKEMHFHQQKMEYECSYCNLTFSKKRNHVLHCQREHSV